MTNLEHFRCFSLKELRNGISLSTGRTHVLRIVPLHVRVRLYIDPNDARTLDDKFILTGCNASGTAEDQHVKTVKDDQIPGDRFVDLLYVPLQPELKYSLEVDPGKEGQTYVLFDNMRGDELGVLLMPDANRTQPSNG